MEIENLEKQKTELKVADYRFNSCTVAGRWHEASAFFRHSRFEGCNKQYFALIFDKEIDLFEALENPIYILFYASIRLKYNSITQVK